METNIAQLLEQLRALRKQAAKLDQAIAAIERLAEPASSGVITPIDRARPWPRWCA